MSATNLLTAKQVGARFSMSPKTVLAGKNIFLGLTRYPLGPRAIRFSEAEVEALARDIERIARPSPVHERHLQIVGRTR